jgi:hypothetical protein
MTNNWAIVSNSTAIVQMVIAWDGVTPYTPPEGTTLYQLQYAGQAFEGWTRNEDGSFTPPPQDA